MYRDTQPGTSVALDDEGVSERDGDLVDENVRDGVDENVWPEHSTSSANSMQSLLKAMGCAGEGTEGSKREY